MRKPFGLYVLNIKSRIQCLDPQKVDIFNTNKGVIKNIQFIILVEHLLLFKINKSPISIKFAP